MKFLQFTIISFLICIGLVVNVSAKLETKTVILKRVTHLVIEIVPDLGTHLIFPFILDEGDSAIPFTMVSTNKIFLTERKPKRNSFVIMVDREKMPADLHKIPEYYGNLFLVVGDYNLTIELKTTDDLTKQVTEYVFELGDMEEELLIQKVINNRVALLEAGYQKRLDEIDELAEKKVISKLAELATTSPKVSNIKEEKIISSDDGDIVLYVDQALQYGRFVSFTYEIENKTDKPLSVTAIQLLQKTKNKVQKWI